MKNKFAVIIVLLMVLFYSTLAAAKVKIISEGFSNHLVYVYVESIKKEMAKRIASNNKINGDYVIIIKIIPPESDSFNFHILSKVLSKGFIIDEFVAENTIFDNMLSSKKTASGGGMFAGLFFFVFIQEHDKKNF